MNYACGDPKVTDKFKLDYMKKTLASCSKKKKKKKNIDLTDLKAGAEKIMIFDSGLQNMKSKFFDTKNTFHIKILANKNTAYYSRSYSKKMHSTVLRAQMGRHRSRQQIRYDRLFEDSLKRICAR